MLEVMLDQTTSDFLVYKLQIRSLRLLKQVMLGRHLTTTSGEKYYRQVTVQEIANSISDARTDMADRTNRTDKTDI